MQKIIQNIQDKVGIVKVFADKPLSLSELTRIASQKIRGEYGVQNYINILDSHFFNYYNIYVVLFQIPYVFLKATSESSKTKN